jgi:hypothetical protein
MTVSVGCGEASSAALLSIWGTPVPVTTVADPSAMTVDEISCPSDFSDFCSVQNDRGYEFVHNRLGRVWRGRLSFTPSGAIRGCESVLKLVG